MPQTGQRVWRFYTIPGKGEPGSETWSSEDVLPRGGGATWVTGSYDPELNLLYWGTGNPNPDYYGGDRMGDNLYTASLVALDADTGKLRWHYQFTPHDLHDWDSNHVPVLADLTIGGRPRKVVMMANRNGFFYTLDRTTGELLVAKPYITTAWAKEIGKDGKPIVLNDGVIPPGGSEATTPCVPDFRGGTVFNPPSYDPALQQFYVMARETCAYYTPPKQEVPRPGRGLHERRHAQAGGARLRRAARHRSAHRRAQVGVPVRAVVARRGDVHGVGPGVCRQPGRRVRRPSTARPASGSGSYRTGSPIWGAAASTYMLDGKQYVLIESGNTLVAFGLPGALRWPRMRALLSRSLELPSAPLVLAASLSGQQPTAPVTPAAARNSPPLPPLPQVFETSVQKVRVSVVASGLVNPWSLAFLPTGEMLVTERPGPAAHRARRRAGSDADCRRALPCTWPCSAGCWTWRSIRGSPRTGSCI